MGNIWRYLFGTTENTENNGNRIYQPRINEKIIGIDFGSSGLCYAYGYLDEKKENHCFIGHFEQQRRDQKILNEIILDDQLSKVLAFGNDCITFLASRSDENLVFHHFKNIKMNLYNKVYKIKAINSGKEADLQYIIKLILIETKKKAIEQLRLNYQDLNENIRFIVTVPAIWNYKSKDIMLKASIASGLITQNDDSSLFFALEPEAASLYFSYENREKAWLINNKEMSFLLCDFGGGTVDIITHKKIFVDGRVYFKELYPPVGNFLGSNKINEYFMDRVIKPLIGEENLKKIKTDLYNNPSNYNDWIKFEKSIEEFKISFQNMDQIEKSCEIDCELFSDFLDTERIDNFNKNNKWKLSTNKKNSYKINFPYQIIYDFMLEIVNKALKLIDPIIKKNMDINNLILCGGASLSNIIYGIFADYMKTISVIRGNNPEVSIGMGSVLFALDPKGVTLRKSRYTIGIKCRGTVNGEKHDNIFSIIIKKGDDVYPDLMENTFYMNSSKARIELYKTENDDVQFCDERDENGQLKIQKFGEYTINVGEAFDKNYREVKVRINLGGTFLSSYARYCKNNQWFDVECLLDLDN